MGIAHSSRPVLVAAGIPAAPYERVLLALATVNGAIALGIDPALVTLEPGPTAGVLAVPGTTLAEALRTSAPPHWV